MATGSYNGGSQTGAGNVISLGCTLDPDDYPNGAVTFSPSTGYLACTANAGGPYTFNGYLCDASGQNAYHVVTLTFNALETTSSFSGSVSNATGLKGKALYFKFEGAYVDYLNLRGTLSVNVATSTSTPDPGVSASTFSAANVNFGASSKVTISNANIASLTHKVTWTVGSKSKSSTTAKGAKTVSYTIPESWMSEAPNSTSVNLVIKVETYKNGSKVGSTASKTYKANVPASVVPTLTSITATIYNENSNIQGQYIQNITGVLITFNGAAAGYQSSLSASSYILTCDKSETMKQDSSNPNKFTVTKLSNSGSIKFTASVKDARGRTSATKTVTITVQQYSAPTISAASAFRCNANGIAEEEGLYIAIQCSANYTNLTGNSMTINSKYWKTLTPNDQYVAQNGMVSGTQYVIGGGNIDPSASYQVQFTVTDTVGKSTTAKIDVATAEYSIHVKNGGKGVAFGKTSEIENAVEINKSWTLYYKGQPIEDMLSKFVFLTSSDNTWSKIWAKINALSVGDTATFNAYASAFYILSNNNRENTAYGTISRRTEDKFCLMLRLNSVNSLLIANLENATASGVDLQYSERAFASDINTLQSDVSNRVVGKRQAKAFTGSSSEQSHRIDCPSGSYLIVIQVPGINRTWFGLVYVAGDGTTTASQINTSQTGITVTTGENRIYAKFTYSSNSNIQMVTIPLRNNTNPTFH